MNENLTIKVLDDKFPHLYELTGDDGRQEFLNADDPAHGDVEKEVHILVGRLMAIWTSDCNYCCLYNETCKSCPSHMDGNKA